MKVRKVEKEQVRHSFSCGACGSDVAAGAQYCSFCGGEFVGESLKDGEASSKQDYDLFCKIQEIIVKNDLAEFDNLLEQYPDAVNWENFAGETLLTFAVYNARKSMVSLLLSLGADCLHEDSNGWTPFSIAKSLAESKFISEKMRKVYKEMVSLMMIDMKDDEMKGLQDALKDEGLVEQLREVLAKYSCVVFVGMGEDPESGEDVCEVFLEDKEGLVQEDIVSVITAAMDLGKFDFWKLLIPSQRNFIVSGRVADVVRVFEDKDFYSVVLYLGVNSADK